MNKARFQCVFLIIAVLMTGCIPYKSIVSYDKSASTFKSPKPIDNYSPLTLEAGDILQIEVSSIEAEVVQVFSTYQTSGYLVSPEGNIDFPMLGTIQVMGKTIEETKAQILAELDKYFVQDPTLNIRLANFKINVNGEVNNPGIFTIPNGKVSVIEAITMAGDFSEFARRDSILVIREKDNMRSFGYLDFNDSKVLNSPYFYLKQNDVIYVKPSKTKLGSIRNRELKLVPVVSLGISIFILTVTLINQR